MLDRKIIWMLDQMCICSTTVTRLYGCSIRCDDSDGYYWESTPGGFRFEVPAHVEGAAYRGKKFCMGIDLTSLNSLLSDVPSDRAPLWSMYEIGRPYDGNKFLVMQNFMGYDVMYRDLLGKPRSWKKSIATFAIMYPEALRFMWMNKDLSFIMKMEMDIKMEGDYIYMSILPKIWKDVCKAAKSKYPFPREYNQPWIQEDKRNVPGCKALKWNRAYAIDALGHHTMNRYPVKYDWVGYGEDSRIMSLEHVKENGTFYNENEYRDELAFMYSEKSYSGFEEFRYGSDNSVSLQYPGLSLLRCS
ncbi:hypothetical protein Tco_0097217 [Tanacetum coccineum]